jgi:enterochelin esterase-like enzyme
MAPTGGAGAASVAGSASGGTAGSTGGGSSGAGAGGQSAGAGGSSGSSGSGGGSGADKIHDVTPEGDGKITIGPTYAKDPDLNDNGNPEGKRFQFTLPHQGTLFEGTDETLTDPVTNQNWGRSIEVYVPAQYKDGDEAPILVIQEGQLSNVSRALDNLTISTDPMKKLPAFIAIAVGNGNQRDGADGKGSERGLEYDTLSDRYTRFIDTQVLPAVLAHEPLKEAYPGIKLTTDPFGRGTMGCSSGGAAALTMGWFGGTFSRIITYSGTFVTQQNETQPEAELYPMGAWEYHSSKELIQNSDRKPLRVFIHASEQDNGNTQPADNGRNWVEANERTHQDLAAKGYHYRYVYSLSSGHCDGKVFDATVAQTLSWMWRGYPTE